MASKNKRGKSWRIEFTIRKKRHSITLGNVSNRAADAAAAHVESLVDAMLGGSQPDRTALVWTEKLDDELHDKLSMCGLVEPRHAGTLNEFIGDYIENRPAKPGTKDRWRQVQRDLLEFFGPNKHVRQVATADAIDWRNWMKHKRSLAENTVRKQTSIARQFFSRAIKERIIATNPFVDGELPTAVSSGDKGFITRETTDKLLERCPTSVKWMLVVALARYGGLRPSEVNVLAWEDILWDVDKIVVRSPKTEHHSGKDQRIIPLWPELRPLLEDAHAIAPDGAVYVVGKGDYRTHVARLIKLAGLQPWPRLFTSMRSSRQTELRRIGV